MRRRSGSNHISTPFGYDDLEAILAVKPGIIRLPKTETVEEMLEIAAIIEKAEAKYGFPAGSIKMMAAIETAKGLFNAPAIAASHPRMTAIAIGGEDFVADLKNHSQSGWQRTVSGQEPDRAIGPGCRD